MEPIYETPFAILSLVDRLVMITPEGMGEPINLCPLMEMLSAPSSKSKGTRGSKKAP